jgi:hypothetical protein
VLASSKNAPAHDDPQDVGTNPGSAYVPLAGVTPTPPRPRILVASTRMKAEHIKGRLHDAMHRGSHKATEEELAEVTAVVLAIVGELGAEMALLIAELEERVEALEGAS